MEYQNKEKPEGENSHSLTKHKNGLKVTNGKETVMDGWEWRDQGGWTNGHIRICIYNMGGWHGNPCTTQRRQVVILQYLTTLKDSDGNRVSGRTMVMG